MSFINVIDELYYLIYYHKLFFLRNCQNQFILTDGITGRMLCNMIIQNKKKKIIAVPIIKLDARSSEKSKFFPYAIVDFHSKRW